MMSGPAAESLGAGAPALGEIIAQKYRVEGVVGRGGMGVVVSARHVQLDQIVAIKLLTLPPDEDRRDEAIARFLQEAKAAARLRNDHVVRIYDVGQLDNGLPFMVMELLNGQDLGSMLDQRGALPEAEAVDYVLQACAGIAEAHHMGIVHRDLKPTNLFVTRRSDGLPLVKVLDFGISKQLSDPDSSSAAASFTNTRTLMGSPNYMSPEQIRDARRVDVRTDIWALGIILQELITDAPVFHGESFPGVCAAIVADPPMPVRTMRPDVSPALEAVIDRCLQKSAGGRFQSVDELAVALSPLGTRLSGSGPRALVYSSQPRVSAVNKIPTGNRATPGSDPTVAMPSGSVDPAGARGGTLESARGVVLEAARGPAPELGREEALDSGRGGTLESARLGSGTHSALSSPDSRIEVLSGPRGQSAPPRAASRWIWPTAVVGLLLVGAVWLQSHRPATSPSASAEAPTPSAPAPAFAPFTLNIDSEPSGATVAEGGVILGTTPFSLSVNLSEGASARVFVIEKDGYQPYVVRQGWARGEVRILAALSKRAPQPAAAPAETASASVAPPSRPVAPRTAAPAKPVAPARPHPAPTNDSSDIRLER